MAATVGRSWWPMIARLSVLARFFAWIECSPASLAGRIEARLDNLARANRNFTLQAYGLDRHSCTPEWILLGTFQRFGSTSDSCRYEVWRVYGPSVRHNSDRRLMV